MTGNLYFTLVSCCQLLQVWVFYIIGSISFKKVLQSTEHNSYKNHPAHVFVIYKKSSNHYSVSRSSSASLLKYSHTSPPQLHWCHHHHRHHHHYPRPYSQYFIMFHISIHIISFSVIVFQVQDLVHFVLHAFLRLFAILLAEQLLGTVTLSK